LQSHFTVILEAHASKVVIYYQHSEEMIPESDFLVIRHYLLETNI